MISAPSRTDIIERFRLEYQVFHGLGDGSPRSWARQQRTRIAEFYTHAGDDLTQWSGSDFQSFLARRVEAGLHVNTVRKYGNQLRSFFGWLYASGFISAEQYLQLKSVGNPRGSTARGLPKPYAKPELDAFWAALDENLPRDERWEHWLRRWVTGKSPFRRVRRHAMRVQVEAIVSLALHCGLRADEIYGLTLDRAHYDNEYVVVMGKGGKERAVPYTGPARLAVQCWIEMRTMMRVDHPSLWLSLYGQRFREPMPRETYDTLVQDQVGPFPLHRFRHTYATERLRAGVPLEVVSRALGHASTNQTLGYAEIVKGDIARHMSATEEKFVKAVMGQAA